MLPQQESATEKTLTTHNQPIIIEESDSNISLPPLAMHAKEATGRVLRKLLCGLITKPFKRILFVSLFVVFNICSAPGRHLLHNQKPLQYLWGGARAATTG